MTTRDLPMDLSWYLDGQGRCNWRFTTQQGELRLNISLSTLLVLEPEQGESILVAASGQVTFTAQLPLPFPIRKQTRGKRYVARWWPEYRRIEFANRSMWGSVIEDWVLDRGTPDKSAKFFTDLAKNLIHQARNQVMARFGSDPDLGPELERRGLLPPLPGNRFLPYRPRPEIRTLLALAGPDE